MSSDPMSSSLGASRSSRPTDRRRGMLPRKAIETTIDIAASAESVWSVLTDGAAYPAWNPFIRQLDGALVEGGRIAITVAPGGGKPMRFTPRLLAVKAARELRWVGRLGISGLFDGEHLFVLEPVDGGTRLLHAEIFTGILVPFVGVDRFRDDFNAMNRALKDRAEALERTR